MNQSFPRFICLVALWLGCVSVRADETVESVTPSIDAETYRLPNGLRVALSKDDRLPLVAINIRYAVGSANDPHGRTGLAHLFEHLFSFARLQSADESPVTLLLRAGATQASAVTSPDRTTYFATLPSARLEFALALEAERMRAFEQTLDQALFSREQAIVRNERRLNVEGKPYGLADEAVFETLFPEQHPYRHRYIGSHADIEATQLSDARDFFRRYYVPGNAILSIAGDIDKVRVKALVEKYFGAIPAGQVPPRLTKNTPRISSPRRVSVTDNIDLPRLTVSWIAPPSHSPGDAEMSLLPALLGAPSGSLYQSLVQRQRIAQDVVVEYLPYALGSVVTIKATAQPGVTLEALQTALDGELASQLDRGWSVEQIDRSRRKLELQMMRGLEKLGDITSLDDSSSAIPYGGVADHLGECLFAFETPDCFSKTLDRYHRITPATLQRAVKSTLTSQSRAIIYAVPGEKVVRDVPAVAAIREARLPMPRQVVLPNGLTVLLLERRQLPVVRVNLLVGAGNVASPTDQPGLASFTVDMLSRGTQRRSALDIVNGAEQLGTVVETDISSDSAALGISVLRSGLDAGVELLADLATQATFPQPEIEKLRASRLAQLTLQLNNPDTLASRRFTELLYGPRSPYGSTGLLNDGIFAEAPPYGYDGRGSETSLKKMTRSQIVDFWKRTYTPGNSVLIVTGDASLDELRALAEKHFGTWQGVGPTGARPTEVPSSPTASNASRERMIIIDRGGASQTVLRVGAAVGSPPGGPDYVPLRMTNIILGEIFSSRITKNLRERHGYTYLARSQLSQRREPGQLFVISTSVRTDATAAAVKELIAELQRIAAEPVSTDELASARNTFMSSITGRFEVSSNAATAIAQLHSLQLPLNYYQSLADQIAAVTVADIQRVAREYLKVENMRIVALGDRSKIEAPLRALALGAVRVE